MAKYRKKPVVVEAFQWTGGPLRCSGCPSWIVEAIESGVICVCADIGQLTIKTLEGVMGLRLGGWIIRGVAGELYPCKPDIFEKTYEAASAERWRDQYHEHLPSGSGTPEEPVEAEG